MAHFLDRVVFSFFAEDIDFLPSRLFSRLLEKGRSKPEIFRKAVNQFSDHMADGGIFGAVRRRQRFSRSRA